jgi:hypothetical protein
VLTSLMQARFTRLLGAVLLVVAAIAFSAITVPDAVHAAVRSDVQVPCMDVKNPLTGNVSQVCNPTVTEDGTPGDPPFNPETGFTPSPPTCLIEQQDKSYTVLDCQSDSGWWSNAQQCYLSLEAVQSAAPAGLDPLGAYYSCTSGPLPTCDPATICVGDFRYTIWLDTPPPGVVTLTPGQAARRLIESFQLEGITVGFAPDPNVAGAKSYVGVPVWMWAENPTPLTFGPYEQTTTLGAVTITARAQVNSIVWNMGDGTTVACANAGTAFVVAYGAVDSPTCGHRYSRTSASQPGGTFPVTATSQWQVTWTGGGESGVIPLTTTATTAVQINEIQSVNVGAGG